MHKHEAYSSFRTWGLLVLLGIILITGWALNNVYPEVSNMLFLFSTLTCAIPVMQTSLLKIYAKRPFAFETLMSVATVGALMIGATAEAAVLLWLFHIREALESYATRRARQGMATLRSLLPNRATLLIEGRRREVDVNRLRPDDIIEVTPGTRLPADAVLLKEDGLIDESALTGEPRPVLRTRGERLSAGSLVVSRTCQMSVASLPGENTIDRILTFIEEADSPKAPTERLLDSFSRYYTPAIVIVSILVMVIPPLLYSQPWDIWIYRGLALMLIGCPCALVFSASVAVTAGLAAATPQRSLIKGRPEVTAVIPVNQADESHLLQLAASVESGSHHPLAKAIVSAADEKSIRYAAAIERQRLPGIGVQGVVGGERVQLLSPSGVLPLEMATVGLTDAIANLERSGQTVIVITVNAQIFGVLALRDTLRADAAQPLKRLKPRSIPSIMLAGDHSRSADAAFTCRQRSGLPNTITLARRTVEIIKQNIALSLGIKAVFLLTSIFGLTGLWGPILADSGAAVLVTVNALRLLKNHPLPLNVNEKDKI